MISARNLETACDAVRCCLDKSCGLRCDTCGFRAVRGPSAAVRSNNSHLRFFPSLQLFDNRKKSLPDYFSFIIGSLFQGQ